MSMDLAKKTYSTTPDYFIAGTTVGVVTAAKEASASIAAHNLVLLDGGKVKPLAAVDLSLIHIWNRIGRLQTQTM